MCWRAKEEADNPQSDASDGKIDVEAIQSEYIPVQSFRTQIWRHDGEVPTTNARIHHP
jgi:hypothetical protein